MTHLKLKKKTFFVVVLSSLLLSSSLIGCGSDSTSSSQFSFNEYTPKDYTNLERELKEASLYCESNPSDCPKNVGMIYANKYGSTYFPVITQCTGFLIAEDIVATNAHCIPDHLRRKNQPIGCGSDLAIRFKDSSSGKKSIYSCREILAFDKNDPFSPDYAFFKINPTGRNPFPIRKDGVKDGQFTKVIKVTPLGNGSGGKIQVDQTCPIALGSLLSVKSTNSWSRTAVGMECQAQEGNSGSPVLNSQGEVIGIVQSLVREEFTESVRKIFRSYNVSMPDQLPSHFIFTNLSCIDDPITRTHRREKCEYGDTLSLTDCLEMNDDQNAETLQTTLENDWRNSLPEIFMYHFEPDLENGKINANPFCVKPSFALGEQEYDQFVDKTGLIGMRRDRISLEYTKSVVLNYQFKIDQWFRISPNYEITVKLREKSTIDIREDDEIWRGIETDESLRSQNVSIPFCTDDQIKSESLSENLSNGIKSEEYLTSHKSEKKVCEK